MKYIRIYKYLGQKNWGFAHKIIISGVLIVLIFLIAFDRWLPYSLLSHYKHPVINKPPILDKYGAVAETFSFPTSGINGKSIQISGWFIPAKQQSKSSKTIVILHTRGGTRQDTLEFGLPLWQKGYNIAVIDLRGHGNSGGKYFTFGYHEWQDVSGLLNYLESRSDGSARDITLIGISAGGAVAIASAQKDPRIKRLVAIASFADLGETIQQQVPWLPKFWRDRAIKEAERIGQFKVTETSPVRMMQKVNCPVLIVHGKEDKYIPFDNAQKLFAVASFPKYFYQVVEANHQNILYHKREELTNKIISFINQ